MSFRIDRKKVYLFVPVLSRVDYVLQLFAFCGFLDVPAFALYERIVEGSCQGVKSVCPIGDFSLRVRNRGVNVFVPRSQKVEPLYLDGINVYVYAPPPLSVKPPGVVVFLWVKATYVDKEPFVLIGE